MKFISKFLLLTMLVSLCLSFGGCLRRDHDRRVTFCEPQTALSFEDLSDFNHGHPGRWSLDFDGNSVDQIPKEEYGSIREKLFQSLNGTVFLPCKSQSEGDYEAYIKAHVPYGLNGHRYYIQGFSVSVIWENETEPLPCGLKLFDGEDGECYLVLQYYQDQKQKDWEDWYFYVTKDQEIVTALTELAEAYAKEYPWPE